MKGRGFIIGLSLAASLAGYSAQADSPVPSSAGDTAIPPAPVILSAPLQDTQKSVLIDVDRKSWESYQFTGRPRGFGLSPLRFLWEFGDGRTADIETPLHHFSGPGTYQVTLSVTDLSTGYTIKSSSVVVEISFFDVANTYLWILTVGIILFTIIVLKILRTIRRRKEEYAKWSNKNSEHPVLIRRKHKPYMKKPPVS